MSGGTTDARNDMPARTNAPDAFVRVDSTAKLQLKLGGMSCSFCVTSITKALGRLGGCAR